MADLNNSENASASGNQVISPVEVYLHDWKPTTNTLAVWKCSNCGLVGFDPHPLPKSDCVSLIKRKER